jgi:hypothetical protein
MVQRNPNLHTGFPGSAILFTGKILPKKVRLKIRKQFWKLSVARIEGRGGGGKESKNC